MVVGAGGVGSAVASILTRREFVETLVLADYVLERAVRAVDLTGDGRFIAAQVDATDETAVAETPRSRRSGAGLCCSMRPIRGS